MKEENIRPKEIYREFRNLVEKEISEDFKNYIRIPYLCPVCKIDEYSEYFEVNTFKICECKICNTFYTNPFFDENAYSEYFEKTKAMQFYGKELFYKTRDERRTKIFGPRVKKVQELLKSIGNPDNLIIDVGGGSGLFADELSANGMNFIIVEPSIDLSQLCREKGYEVYTSFFEDFLFPLTEKRVILSSFELIEHLRDPNKFFKHAFENMRSGDKFYFTTLNGGGLDIRVLWEKSIQFLPPLHLNIFNVKSIQKLVESIGFSIVEITTPGQLDVNILENNMAVINDHFWKYFLLNADSKTKTKFQEVLSDSGFSSHLSVILEKP